MTATFATLSALDTQLAARGHHPLTPWWRGVLERFYAHPTARTLAAQVGRGGAKSHTSVKVSLNEVLFANWRIPAGERHFWSYISTTKDEASQRLGLIERFLTDLGVPYDRNGDEIALRDQPRGWRVFAATIGSVSGFRCFGFSCDELAKWRTPDRYANPAPELVASANAMCVTHADSRRCLLISSPMGINTFHHQRVQAGDNDEQIVVQAPTWIANPSVTEEQTRALEPDERIWTREYGAVAQAGALSVFEPGAIARAFRQPEAMGPAVGRFGVIDPSSGKKDTWSFGIGSWRDCGGKRRLVFDKIDGFEGAFWKQRSGDQIVATVADSLRAQGVHVVHSDQRESLMLRAAFMRHQIRFIEHPWTGPAKERAVSTVRRWLADDLLVLPDHDRLRDELLEFEERATPSGGFTFGARGSGHDDYVALILTAAIADANRSLPGSPSHRRGMVEALRSLTTPGGQIRLQARLNAARGLR